MPAIVLGELHSGFLAGTRREENEARLRQFLGKRSVLVLDVTAETALRYAEIDALLRRKGRPIPRNDVWIAASAVEHGMRLVTVEEHFDEIPLLIIEPRA
jgi:tRNA(fMet)-specific endonuclease VapC